MMQRMTNVLSISDFKGRCNMKVNTLTAAENIFRRYEAKHNVIEHYYGLLAYYALGQIADAKKSRELIQKCTDYLSLYPDKFPHPHYNFECYRVGGIAKAWLFLNGYMPETADELRRYADITMNSPHCEDGIISHPENDSITWIDIAAFIPPFMLYTGLKLGEQKYVDYATYSCLRFYDELTDRTNGLLHQCRGFLEHKERVTSDHWSRGNGWGYLGITELMQHLPENSDYKEKAIKYYVAHTDALIENQTERGMWRQEIPEELRETEEDKELDRKEAERNKKIDKIINWVSAILLLGVLGYAIYRLITNFI